MFEETKIIISSYVSTFTSTLITYPLDSMKIWKQSNQVRKPNISNLFAGVSYPLLTNGFTNSLLFLSTEKINKNFNNYYISGFISGATTSIIINPIEYFKVRKQINKKIKNPFTGMNLCILRESIGCSIYFGIYYELKERQCNDLISGGLSGLSSWLFTYPIDVLKTRIQSDMSLNQAIKQRNFLKGLNYCIFRAGLSNAILFYTYQTLYNFIK